MPTDVAAYLWGVWDGFTAFPMLILHVFGVWNQNPVYDIARHGGWYQLGFIFGVAATCGTTHIKKG